MRASLPNPFYYLDNFQQVLDWVFQRHGDLLDEAERAFVAAFADLPKASRALLVRMVMRKGELFRASKLDYAEIGCPHAAADPLAALGWLDTAPLLSGAQLFALLNKTELLRAFALTGMSGMRKSELFDHLGERLTGERALGDWYPALGDRVFQLCIGDWCERLRLMFFGNLRQDWSEFVLADLGIYRYEQVDFSPAFRAFHRREDIDAYLHLHRCREAFERGEPVTDVLEAIPREAFTNPWLEARRGKLLLRVGQQLERQGELAEALRVHTENPYAGARERAIRVLERCDQPEAALELAERATAAPESEQEAQHLQRIVPRLQRCLGRAPAPRQRRTTVERLDLRLALDGIRVEQAVRDHLSQPQAPVHYVENALLGSLFGLLCWDALFAPLPGAFFHPFHWAPADLDRPDFYQRRAALFRQCLARLDTDAYRSWIWRTYREKSGIHSAFVAWGLVGEQLLEQALTCIAPHHLKLIFQRMLTDVRSNRSGLPDLVQFWPAERRYRMIEVKGPGDRLQDNQQRWIEYALRHELPISVCHVTRAD